MAHSVAAVDHEGSASTLEELDTPFAQAIAGDPKKRIVMIERGLTWAAFLFLLYILRHFFLVVFLTFLISYMMRSLVVAISSRLPKTYQSPLFERILTVICFLLFLWCLYGIGGFFGPRLLDQVQKLSARVSRLNPEQEFSNLLSRTVGVYLFDRDFGTRSDERYKKAFEAFKAEGAKRYDEFQQFPQRVARVEGARLHVVEDEESVKFDAEYPVGSSEREQAFQRWFMQRVAPKHFTDRKQDWIDRFEAELRKSKTPAEIEALKKSVTFQADRNNQIYLDIYRTLGSDPAERLTLEKNWRQEEIAERVKKRTAAAEFQKQLQEEFERERQLYPGEFKYDFERYLTLKKAHQAGPEAFTKAIQEGQTLSEPDQTAQAYVDFEAKQKLELSKKWWETDRTAHMIKDAASKTGEETLAGFGHWAREAIKHLLGIPVQVSLAMLLSFFITFDVPNLHRGIESLKRSRYRAYFNEIIPELATFGKLIGRSFQSQALIAIVNTILTYISIKFIGIENEYFLSAIVFICSFIPVLGTVLSTVPIAIVALVQPDGSLWKTFLVILAVLLVHFLETSVLNPKIIGDVMHLHPVLVLTVLAIGEHFFGMWGLLLAVPITVYIIHFVIFDHGIPGIIEPVKPPSPLIVPESQKALANA